jgi:hypothetical protein
LPELARHVALVEHHAQAQQLGRDGDCAPQARERDVDNQVVGRDVEVWVHLPVVVEE